MAEKEPKVCAQVRPMRPDDPPEVVELLGRDAILGAQDGASEIVHVPEWGGYVCVKGLTGAERDRFEQACIDARKGTRLNLSGLKVRLLALSVVDGNGAPLFSEKDLAALNAKSASAIERVYTAAQRLSRLSPEDVEELVGNSGGDLSDASGSD